MASIRVSNGVVPIEVNDAGETIDLRTDAEFIKACLRMQQGFAKTKEKYDKVLGDDKAAPEQVEEAIDGMFSETDATIDGLFGGGACKKIFPASRSIMQYIEFFNQLLQILEDEQNKAAEKYTRPAARNR